MKHIKFILKTEEFINQKSYNKRNFLVEKVEVGLHPQTQVTKLAFLEQTSCYSWIYTILLFNYLKSYLGQNLKMRCATHYSKDTGAPSKPIRLMLLKQLENLSDEAVVVRFKHDPYHQVSQVLAHIESSRGKAVKGAVCDGVIEAKRSSEKPTFFYLYHH